MFASAVAECRPGIDRLSTDYKIVASVMGKMDHIVPYSKGGTSLKVENIQLLCARHNIEKSANIQ